MNDLRLDWYEATLECETVSVIGLAMLVGQSIDGEEAKLTVGRGMRGYRRSHRIESSNFDIQILDLHDSGWPHIIGTGASADAAKRIARSIADVGRVTRIDIACDSLEGWNRASQRFMQWAEDHPNSQTTVNGDFIRGERGRTLYLGSPQSERRIRVYEKGIQLGLDPDWVRVEFQYRPPNRNAKAWAFEASTADIANSYRAFVALRATEGFYSPPAYQPPGREPLFALARQYGNVLREELPEAWRIIVDHLKLDWRPE